jgi:hypothetical protein
MTDDVTGILELDADAYHDDLVSTSRPSLSKSTIHTLLTDSPAHAKAKHPRLNPSYAPQQEERFDIGTACHALLLEGRNAVEVVNADDWRTTAAKVQREGARANGKIPLLEKHWMACQDMIGAAREQLDAIAVDPPLFVNGRAEQTIVWEEDDVLCRARCDWLHDNAMACDDYKTTSRSAHPEAWSRALYGIGADLQHAFYCRGIKAVTGVQPVFRFVVQETFAPYALSVIQLTPAVVALANEKLNTALEIWKRCLETNVWPAYPQRVCWADLPPWEEARFLERDAMRAAA